MAEIIRYIDPDATGAGDGTSWADAYVSMFAFDAAEETDLVTADNWMHVYCRASSGTADALATTITGWTTDDTHYILFEAAEGDQALITGISETRYRRTEDNW
jgi:hypothetical protein